MAEITLTSANFDEIVLKSELPVMVDFWATWCGPCRQVGPIIEEIAAEMEGKAVVGKVNVDEEPELTAKYGIASIPTIKVFSSGEVKVTSVGVKSKDELIKLFD